MNKQRAFEQRRQLSGDGNDDNDDIYLDLGYDYARAIILVPNKELANQVMRMALPLCGGDDALVWGPNGAPPPPPFQSSTDTTTTSSRLERLVQTVRIGLLPGNLSSPTDYQPFRTSLTSPRTVPPLDLVVTTPASLSPLGPSPKNVDLFADVATLIIDEADMLLDGGYVRPLENVLLGFKRADRISARNEWDDDYNRATTAAAHKKTQMVLVAATLPDVGLRSVEAYVAKKFPKATRVTMKGMHNARHYGIKNQSLWIEDDPQVLAAEGPSGVNRRRMEVLVHMLLGNDNDDDDDDDASASLSSSSSLRGEKVMVFLNSVEDVDGATNALRRAGVNAVPYHAKIPLAERGNNLNAFRKFVAKSSASDHTPSSPSIDQGPEDDAVPVLVCTDLAARGLDVPGVTAVVQLQFAGNVVSHLHRMGRCGRAGNRDGRGVIFYDGGEGTQGDLVRVVREAEDQQEKMGLVGDYGGDDDDMDVDNDFTSDHAGDGDRGKKGKVQNAFSRKRGFRKKRKKVKRSIAREDEGDYYRAQSDDQIY